LLLGPLILWNSCCVGRAAETLEVSDAFRNAWQLRVSTAYCHGELRVLRSELWILFVDPTWNFGHWSPHDAAASNFYNIFCQTLNHGQVSATTREYDIVMTAIHQVKKAISC